MNKRILSIVLSLMLLAGLLTTTVRTAQPQGSEYLSNYAASLRQGSERGELSLTYFVHSPHDSRCVVSLGISKIEVYRGDGTYEKTIEASSDNALLRIGASATEYGTQIITCEPGTEYYCRVTFLAQTSSGSDTRTVTTASAIAHP